MKDEAKVLLNEKSLTQMGMILGYDVFINNSDRLRSLWDNNGNGRNILISPTLGAIAIDQVINAVDVDSDFSAEMCKRYFAKSAQFLEGALKLASNNNLSPNMKRAANTVPDVTSKFASSVLENVRKFLQDLTGHDIGTSGIRYLAAGVATLVANVRRVEVSTLVAGRKWLKNLVRLDWAHVWAKSTKLVHLNYLRKIIHIFHTVADRVLKARSMLPKSSFNGDRSIPCKKGLNYHLKNVAAVPTLRTM